MNTIPTTIQKAGAQSPRVFKFGRNEQLPKGYRIKKKTDNCYTPTSSPTVTPKSHRKLDSSIIDSASLSLSSNSTASMQTSTVSIQEYPKKHIRGIEDFSKELVLNETHINDTTRTVTLCMQNLESDDVENKPETNELEVEVCNFSNAGKEA